MILGAFLGLSVASCADQNFDWEEAKSQNPEYVFRSNFEKLVGKIDPNQSWDFSGNTTRYGTRAGEVVTEGKSETFSKELRGAIASVLPEGSDNHAVGGAYTFISQGPFDIYPLYHGKCMQWDLYVNDEKVGNYAAIMSKMGEGTSFGNGSTSQLTTTGWRIDLPVGTPIFIKLVITKNRTGYATEGQYAKNGDVVTSVYNPAVPYNKGTLSNGSLLLPWEKLKDKRVEKPDNLDYIIMFEDAKTKSGDADFNDFVLGIKGRPSAPDPIDVKDNEYTLSTPGPTKRYMVEDLGSLAETDVDFNDIVVDFSDDVVTTYKVTITTTTKQDGTIEQKTKTEVTETKHNQTAKIRALGGTLNFTLYAGTKDVFNKDRDLKPYKYTEMLNTLEGKIDYEHIYKEIHWEGTDWDPATNNIKVIVNGRTKDGTPSKTDDRTGDKVVEPKDGDIEITFPAPGTVPYIIAFDPTKPWRVERRPICQHWLFGSDEDCDCGSEDGINYPEMQ